MMTSADATRRPAAACSKPRLSRRSIRSARRSPPPIDAISVMRQDDSAARFRVLDRFSLTGRWDV